MKKLMKNGRLAAVLLAVVMVLAAGAVCITAPAQVEAKISASKIRSLKKQVNAIIAEKTKTTDTKKDKLKKLFKYVTYTKKKNGKTIKENFGYARNLTFDTDVKKDGWDKLYALEMLKNRKGSCYHFAVLYGYLAQQATGYPVRVAWGTTNGYGNAGQDHSWTEVKIGKNWYVCDTNLDKFGGKKALTYYLKRRSQLKKVYENYKKAKYLMLEF